MNCKNKGFTLLEVMVAMTILAMSLATIQDLFSKTLLDSMRAEMVTKATMLARQKMAEQVIKLEKDIQEGKFPNTDEETEGTFDEPYNNFKWHVHIRKVEIPMPPPKEQDASAQLIQMLAKQIGESLREVKLEVIWDDLGEKQNVTVATHVIKK